MTHKRVGIQKEGAGDAGVKLPELPQAKLENGYLLLDLESPLLVTDGAVQVVIPPYPERNPGDRITVQFRRGNDEVAYPYAPVVCRYFYLQESLEPIRVQPLQALPPGHYEVSYMVTSSSNNASSSGGVPVLVVNTPPPAYATGEISLFGKYLAGQVASWVVPSDRLLAPSARDVLFRAIGQRNSEAGVTLNIYRVPAGKSFAEQVLFAMLSCSDGRNWVCAGADEMLFARGDLVSIQLEGDTGDAAGIYLAISM
jgi:hypothetical protein